MKLNLLPTSITKERQSKVALFISICIALAGIFAAVALAAFSSSAKIAAHAKEAEQRQAADQVNQIALSANDVIAQAADIIRDEKLAQKMIDHNYDYPRLYDKVKPWIPPFFRVTRMSATPTGTDTCTITLVGVLHSYQQYADLMLALLRIPDSTTVSRAGYINEDPFVPPLAQYDQSGMPRKPNESPIPDDPLARLTYLQSTASTQRYTGVGNFGGDPTLARGAGPDESLITVTVAMKGSIQTPNPRDTLSAAGGGTASASASPFGGSSSGFGAPGGYPGAPGGMGGPGGPMGGPPGAVGGPGARAPSAGGDSSPLGNIKKSSKAGSGAGGDE